MIKDVDSLGVPKHKQPKKSKKKLLATIGALFGFAATFLFPFENNEGQFVSASFLPISAPGSVELGFFPIAVPVIKWGFAIDTLQVSEYKVRHNENLGSIVSRFMDNTSVANLVQNSDGIFDLNKEFRSGKSYALLTRQGQLSPDYLIFEPNVFEYVIFNLKGDLKVEKIKREIETKNHSVAGSIESSLWETLTKLGVNYEAAAKMEDALQWSVDFNHIQNGDQFKLVYDENFIHGKSVGAGQVYAAFYHRKDDDKEHYAFWFDNGDYKGFYDIEGRPAARTFLKAPVKFSRISSKYTMKRFHPILKRVKPHLGTDFAAPEGTPIYAVANGVIEDASYTRGNGKYVKIRHDKVYETQYLHMCRFAKGIRPGVPVSQGQVIGYVGSTGFASGPHVCFRFWKNGRQVNPLKENMPAAKQLPKEALEEFYTVRDKYLTMLKGEPVEKVEEDTGLFSQIFGTKAETNPAP